MKEYTFYKLCCNNLDIKYQYVGSTTNFINRKCKHKSACNGEKTNHLKVYKTINENGGWDAWSMIKIESKPFETKLDAHKHERWWFEDLNADMNSQFPQRNKKEYYQTNKKIIDAKQKEYNVTNKYKIKDKKQEYYNENKEEISNKNKIKIQCPCGSIHSYGMKSNHLQTKKHIKFINNQIETPNKSNINHFY